MPRMVEGRGQRRRGNQDPTTIATWEERVANRRLFEVECYETDG